MLRKFLARVSSGAPARVVARLTFRHALAATIRIAGLALFMAFWLAWLITVTTSMHITSMIYIAATALIVILNSYRAAMNFSRFAVEFIIISYIYERVVHKHFHGLNFPNPEFPGSWLDHISLLSHFVQLPPPHLGINYATWFIPIALFGGAIGAVGRAIRIARTGLEAQGVILSEISTPRLQETVSMQVLLQISDTHCVSANDVPVEFREKQTQWDGPSPNAESIATRVKSLRDKIQLIKNGSSVLVHSGDATDSGKSEEWAVFNRSWDSGARIFYSPGNHDLSISATDPFLSDREKKLERFQEQIGNADVIAMMHDDARTLGNFLVRASLRMSVMDHFLTKGTLIENFSVGRSSFTAAEGVYPAFKTIEVELLNASMPAWYTHASFRVASWLLGPATTGCDEDPRAENCIDSIQYDRLSYMRVGTASARIVEGKGSLADSVAYHFATSNWYLYFGHRLVGCEPLCLPDVLEHIVNGETALAQCNPPVSVVFLNSCRYQSHWILTNAVGWHGATQRKSLKDELKTIAGPLIIVTHHKIAEFSRDVLPETAPKWKDKIAQLFIKLERAFGIALDGRELLQIASEYASRSSGNPVLLLHGHSHQERVGIAQGEGTVSVCSCASSTLGNVENGKLDQTLRILEIRLGSTGQWIVVSHRSDTEGATWSASRIL